MLYLVTPRACMNAEFRLETSIFKALSLSFWLVVLLGRNPPESCEIGSKLR